MAVHDRFLDPGFDAFEERYRLGASQIVSTRRVADLETPVGAYLKIAAGQPNSFLLESIEGGAARGRYSVIGVSPDLAFRARGNEAEINLDPQGDPEGYSPCAEPTLAALRKLVNETRIDLPEGMPPMASGLFGYMGYDCVRLMEDLGRPGEDALDLPDAVFLRPTIIVIFDNVRDELTIVTPVRPQAALGAREAYEAARARIERVTAALDRPLPSAPAAGAGETVKGTPAGKKTAEEYGGMVERAKEYIRAGDIFQVVLSQRFEIPFALPPLSFYRALRRTNPAPFLFFFELPGFAIAGSSPEILVRLRGDKVTIRPLAGTRPRGTTAMEDEALAAELLADEKERSEHLMLLDLGRNDVGRVARPASVKVTEQFQIERYSQVMHIVSHVEGELDPARDCIDALVGGFPAGTVSGAPKVRAMEIIDELEGDKRGLYAGAVGYFAANGDMDTCIALRTAVIKDGKVHVRAGAGIVAESDPMAEHRECLNKARALFRAADEAVRFAARSRAPEPVEP
ncbi:anthranilate synthase component I [Lutibaculum baratangense]|uniref:Anthranilate synthase component 1 n=1 Tax=Lutibaculum baratangense AMV1 TaxID=631454 RepID=V4RBH4_9HYPH|nr:anthranilate synthase component I [Lutibaculum baratangense]ESR23491.1 Anthranilate synthase, aminase component [Lutibaculum baratangense AMV1]